MSVPFVSVIMPIHNEEQFIERSLSAVLEQSYPHDRYEILIADGMSNDKTVALVEATPDHERIRIIQNSKRLQSPGLNALIQIAQGEIIVRVDAHTIIAADYIAQCVAELQETGAANVGGQMHAEATTITGQAIALAMHSRFAVPTAFHVGSSGQFTDTVYMGAWPKQILVAVGGFDERLRANEDYELNVRIRSNGGTIYLSPKIRSTYYGRQTFPTLARQYFIYGTAKVNTLRKHPTSLRFRQTVAPLFVAVLLLGIPLAVWFPLARIVWIAIIGMYIFCSLFFSLLNVRRSTLTIAFRIPLVYATMHISWGLGFWSGWLTNKSHRYPVQLANNPTQIS